MSDAKLGILLTADVSSATSNVALLEKQLERLQRIASLPGLSFTQQERLNGLLLKTQANITTFNRAAALSNPVLQKFNQTTTQSSAALLNLGRVAQDAPFGFLGIANNLNPLLESFQRLKTSTGSTGGALKAMAKDLTGAGGLGFAISIVSSLLIVFGDKLFGSSKAAKEAKEANQKLGEELAGSAVKLTSLVGIVQNVNSKYEEKVKALKAINQEYKSYLESLGIEEVTATNIALAYDKIVESMIRQAVVRGLQDEITKAVQETATKIVALEKAEEKRRLASEKVNDQVVLEKSGLEKARDARERYNKTNVDGILANQRSNAEQTKQIGTLNHYEAAIKRLTDQLKKDLAPALNLVTEFGDLGIKLNTIKPVKTDEIKLAPSKVVLADVKEFDFDALRVSKFLKGKFKIPFTPILETDDPGGGTQVGDLSDAEKAMIKAGKDLGETFNSAFQSGFADSLSSLGEGIGNVLSGKDFGAGIINVMGDLITQIGKALIKYGIIKEGLDKILGPGGILIPGGLAIGLGVAAIAIGAVFKNFGGFRAGGGPVGPNQSFVVGERGPELFIPSSTGTIIPNNGRSSFGGSQAKTETQYLPIFKGTDLYLMIKRTEKYLKGNG